MATTRAEDTGYKVVSAPFPAPSKTRTTTIAGHPTTATTLYFADKILITITQNGRLAHWVHVPLDVSATDSSLASLSHEYDSDAPPSDLLPMHQLTATTILGGTLPDLDVLAQTLATNIASAIKTRNERELRTVVLGTGLDRSMKGRAEFSDLVGLVLDVL
ncbi:hypothetical protein P171DRAFT_473838 [Karstenula rhodostoma CBS 690.94]|uniref:Proteasome assembly chaperone 3 n=1 Tax=Karstenula rhodostoma CBS 690.94 TaxID=1392251 RepID=A0A9P4UBS3_9PLEO|nr:hypothetical protein P171DRAFT_473838 [Karstenula rhodostoma CBS 690.94]